MCVLSSPLTDIGQLSLFLILPETGSVFLPPKFAGKPQETDPIVSTVGQIANDEVEPFSACLILNN